MTRPQRRLDWMCIGIRRTFENAEYADYLFESDVWEPDPRFKSRLMKVGLNQGSLRIQKVTGEVVLLKAMPEDDGNSRFERAARKIRSHWEKHEFPVATMFACG